MVTADHARNMPWMSGCMELFNCKQYELMKNKLSVRF